MIKLEKISRKEFCRQLEGKFVCMCGFRTHETFEEDLKVLEENQDYKGKQQYIFYPRSNGFIRAHVSLKYEAQKGARVRTITFEDVIHACRVINEKWQAPKKHMRHCIVDVSPHAQSFPNCYHGIPMTTTFRLEYKTKGWYLVGVKLKQTFMLLMLQHNATFAIMDVQVHIHT